jgi:hypothetical protein
MVTPISGPESKSPVPAPRRYERRNDALPMKELYLRNVEALTACGMTAVEMRYALNETKASFIYTFEGQVPVGMLGLTFPRTYPDNLVAEGWKKFMLILDVIVEGQLGVKARGRYERDGVPLEVETELLRSWGQGARIVIDTVAFTDLRTKERFETSLETAINDKLKDGTRKFCRKEDNLIDMSVEGVVAIATRYLKDAALRRRVLKK